MSDRMSTLLHDAAPRPAGEIDTTALYRQATRRRRSRHGLSAAAIVVALAVVLPLAWPGARSVGPIIGDGQTNTPAPGTTIPTQEELLAPYRELFAGLSEPTGTLTLAAGRIDGLGVVVAPGTSVDLSPPDYDVDDPDTSFVLRVRDETMGTVVVEETYGGDQPRENREFLAGAAGSRYAIEHEMLVRDELVERLTDVVVVVDPVAAMEVVLTTTPARVDEHRWQVDFALVNRGTVSLTHGAGYQLYAIDENGWHLVDNPAVELIGYGLPPASISTSRRVRFVGDPGTYRLVATASWDDGTHGDGGIHAAVSVRTFATDGSTPVFASPDPSPDRIRGMLQVGKNVSLQFLPSDDSVRKLGVATASIRFDTAIDPAVLCVRTGEPVPDWTPTTGDIIEISTPYGLEESMPPTLVPSEVFVDC